MQFRRLGNTDLRVSRLGFGGSPLGNEFGDVDAAECTRAVHAALDLGINFIDVAPYYGRTLAETRLGNALAGRRQGVVVATKCGRYDLAGFNFSAARIRASIDESLQRLRTDCIDLWQAHDLEFGDEREIIEETVPTMRDIQRQGKVRYIGITGFQLRLLERVAVATKPDAVLSYGRYNLLVTDMDRLLTPTLEQHGIGLIVASPLHMGILSETGPPAWHPAPEVVKKAGAEAAALCRARGVDIATVALQFAMAHPYAATTLAGMTSVEQVRRNVAAAEGTADPELVAELRKLFAPVADLTWATGKPENEDYGKVAAS